MLSRLQKFSSAIRQHRYGITLIAFLAAGAVTGVGCVWFMWAFEFVLRHRLDFGRIGPWCFITTPVLFLTAVELIRRFAPQADGAGIPQVVFASKHLNAATEKGLAPLVQMRTLAVKVLALLIGLWAGASTGREGPTVHVAACLFFSAMVLFRRWFGLNFDLRSAVVAGGAAGLAAAFNAPLAGVTFAIEELSSDYFSTIKDYVLMAIIFASLAAIALTGDTTYFGTLTDPAPLPLFFILGIGIIGGFLGSFFSTALVRGNKLFARLRLSPYGALVPILLSLVLLVMLFIGGVEMLGPGNHVAQELVRGELRGDMAAFPFTKMAATLVTYWSGIAGGIFAPCLSIGSSLGAALGHWMGLSVASCALVGMAAFLSGTIQAPMTAFVIIFEMTGGHHQMLIPIMLASLIAFLIARLLKSQHLYQALAANYEFMLGQ